MHERFQATQHVPRGRGQGFGDSFQASPIRYDDGLETSPINPGPLASSMLSLCDRLIPMASYRRDSCSLWLAGPNKRFGPQVSQARDLVGPTG